MTGVSFDLGGAPRSTPRRRPREAAHGASKDGSTDCSGDCVDGRPSESGHGCHGRARSTAEGRGESAPDVSASGDAASERSAGQRDACRTPGHGCGGWGLCGSAFMCPTSLRVDSCVHQLWMGSRRTLPAGGVRVPRTAACPPYRAGRRTTRGSVQPHDRARIGADATARRGARGERAAPGDHRRRPGAGDGGDRSGAASSCPRAADREHRARSSSRRRNRRRGRRARSSTSPTRRSVHNLCRPPAASPTGCRAGSCGVPRA